MIDTPLTPYVIIALEATYLIACACVSMAMLTSMGWMVAEAFRRIRGQRHAVSEDDIERVGMRVAEALAPRRATLDRIIQRYPVPAEWHAEPEWTDDVTEVRPIS